MKLRNKKVVNRCDTNLNTNIKKRKNESIVSTSVSTINNVVNKSLNYASSVIVSYSDSDDELKLSNNFNNTCYDNRNDGIGS